jgi:hypothetical protein
MTQLVTPQLVARYKAFILAALTMALLNLIVAVALVSLLLRVQGSADDTNAVLNQTVDAVRAGSPAAATTRNQMSAMCDAFLADQCPHTPAEGDPFAPPPTTPSGR